MRSFEPTAGPARLRRERDLRGWEARSAMWRALALARFVFGREARVRMVRADGDRFRGLLHLEVPVEDVADHLEREDVFVACAALDEVLCGVPCIFVFHALERRPAARPLPEIPEEAPWR